MNLISLNSQGPQASSPLGEIERGDLPAAEIEKEK